MVLSYTFCRKLLVDKEGCGPLTISFPTSFQSVFQDECKFKETLLPNNYNAYESSIYKGFYIALSKHGRLKRGYKATPAMTVTHFLPRLWAKLAITHSFCTCWTFSQVTYTYVQGTTNELQSKDTKHVIIVFILVNEIYVYMGSCVSDLCVYAILCCLSFLLRLYEGRGAFFRPLSLFMGACYNWCLNLTPSSVWLTSPAFRSETDMFYYLKELRPAW